VGQNDTYDFTVNPGGYDYVQDLTGGYDTALIDLSGGFSFPPHVYYVHAGNGSYVDGVFRGAFQGTFAAQYATNSVNSVSVNAVESLSVVFSDSDDVVQVDAAPLASGGTLSLNGGLGNNTLDINFSQLGNTIFVAQPNGAISASYGSYANFSTFTITLGFETNTASTGGGDDRFISVGGTDTIDGGAGNDAWSSNRGNDSTTYWLNTIATAVDNASGATVATVTNVETYNIFDSLGSSTFHVDGSARSSLIYAGSGSDSLHVDFRGTSDQPFPNRIATDGFLYNSDGGVQWFGIENFDIILSDGNSTAVLEPIAGSTYHIDGGLGENQLSIGDVSTNFTRIQDGDSYIFTSIDGSKSFTLLRIDDVLFYDGWLHLPRPGVTVNGSAANDTISPTKAPAGQPKPGDLGDTIFGFGGNDKIDGGKGGDRMVGGIGNDTYTIDDAFDTVEELTGEGTDTMTSAKISFTLAAEVEKGTLTGALALDITGNTLANSLTGNGAANHLYGLAGKDSINGKAGDDFLYGGNDDDTLTGDLGNDQLYGDQGKDKLKGGAGADTLTGGTEADQFQFDAASLDGMIDTITDFSHTEKDKISLSAIDADGAGGASNGKFAFIGTAAFTVGVKAQVRYEVSGGNATVQADINGDGVADLVIALTGVATLVAADFVL
jgi:Ca2+-binding RTX toxin-like protein